MAVRIAKFRADLRKFRKIGLDTSVLIHHLEDVAPYADLTEAAFAAIAAGVPTAVLSTLSVTELLVQPFADRHEDRVVPAGHGAAKEAARLRALYGLRTPDALLVATALGEGAEAFLTNETRLRVLKPEPITMLVLGDYV